MAATNSCAVFPILSGSSHLAPSWGMDWHSSGITTSVLGSLKRGLSPRSKELGLHVCGGRGSHSRKTPHELIDIGVRVGIDGAALANVSRLVAKVDSAALQDEFDLYLHGLKLRERLGFKRAAGRGRPKTRRHHAQHAQNRRSVQRFGWRYTINA
jgi:hypothetical protein